jgi:cation diffusion facilitator family transporter
MSAHRHYPAARRATLIGAVINLLLSGIKVVVGVVGHSQALIADGIHSLSDLVSDLLVLVGAKQGEIAADEQHPYGHGRIETLTTVAVGLLLIAVAAGISVSAVQRLFEPALLTQPTPAVLVAALLSILLKEGLYHYTLRVANRIRSNLLRANAWHHRSDALSSVVVLIGVAGTMAGLDYLDAIAAVIVSLMVAKAGVELGWEAVQELIDTGLGQEKLRAIREEIQQVEGVRAMHRLRTRRMGANVLVDLHILVDPRLSVSEGHHIADHVELTLFKQIPDISDVTVHIDPENDEQNRPCTSLPMRNELIQRLAVCWADTPECAYIEDYTLHYLDGELDLEVWLPLHRVESKARAEQLKTELANCLVDDPQIKRVRPVFF